ncbi:MAG: hypothetical protein IPO28_15240 [Holophagaceae bacterium]|nr:hypothetical protein [Holophagaceae bacterium]
MRYAAFEGAEDGWPLPSRAGLGAGARSADAFLGEPFLRWKRLQVSGADLRTAPSAVTIKAVDWTGS